VFKGRSLVAGGRKIGFGPQDEEVRNFFIRKDWLRSEIEGRTEC
jgi:hypothetical protein